MGKLFNSFLEKSFPIKDPFLRKENGFIHNLIKWVALRISFLLFRLKISANTLDIVSCLLLIPIFFTIFQSIFHKNIILFFIGYFFLGLIILVDFVDGQLARIHKYNFTVGDNLDNLCPDLIKFMSYLSIGLVTQSDIFFIFSILLAMIITNYINITVHAIDIKHQWLLRCFMNKMSLNGFRILVMFIVPALITLFIFDFIYINFLSKIILIIYFIFSMIWMLISFQSRIVE